MRKGTVVYFQCNNWNPYPEEAGRFIYDYLEGTLYTNYEQCNPVNKTEQECLNWIKSNDLCINCDIYDQSVQYWVTTTKEWIKENFPELLEYASEEPQDDIYEGDKKYFLKYIEENIGQHWATETMERKLPDKFNEYKNRFIEV